MKALVELDAEFFEKQEARLIVDRLDEEGILDRMTERGCKGFLVIPGKLGFTWMVMEIHEMREVQE